MKNYFEQTFIKIETIQKSNIRKLYSYKSPRIYNNIIIHNININICLCCQKFGLHAIAHVDKTKKKQK